jgi:hypothetical protein
MLRPSGIVLPEKFSPPEKGTTYMNETSTRMGNAGAGIVKLINQVEVMLAESGDPVAASGFDVDKWLTNWMNQPMPSLGGRRPIEYMDTIEGQNQVSRLLVRMQSGAFT